MSADKLISEFLSLVDVEGYTETYSKDIQEGKYFGLPLKSLIECEKRLRTEPSIAYFSMEYGLATSFYNKFSTARPVNPDNKNQEQEVFSNYRLADYFFGVKIYRLFPAEVLV